MTGVHASADWVLHVCERESEWSRTVEESLARSGVAVETHPDVYLALAALTRRRPGRCLAIFLGIDWLDGGEFTFPDVAGRFVGGVPIWGYASRLPASSLALVASRRVRLIEDAGQLELIVSRLVCAGGGPVATSETVAPRRAAPASVGDRLEAGELPVPWAPRPANPARLPPLSRDDRAGRGIPSAPNDPVLTPDEIDALTSGDFCERGEP